MNLTFETIDTLDRSGIACLVQRAAIPTDDNRRFWITWKQVRDHRLKDSVMLRKEGNPLRWYAYRIIPQDPGLNVGPMPVAYVCRNTRHLLSYQPRAVSAITRSLIDHGSAVDGSSTGLGKTYVGLACCRELNQRPAIICRKAGIAGWMKACRYMDIDPVCIINWESARRGFRYMHRSQHPFTGRWQYQWNLPRNTMIIYDECHMGANAETQNAGVWLAAATASAHPVLSLSATLADRPSRLSNLFQVLGICDPKTFEQWLLRRGHFFNQHNELESLSSVQDMMVIHQALYPRYGARLSYDDPDVREYFPDVVYQVELVSLDNVEARRENDAYGAMIAKVRALRAAGAAHASLLVEEMRYRQAAELLKAPILADYARDYMQEGLSVCIFVNFRETLAALAQMLDTRSLVFGEQDRYHLDRQKVIADFQANRSRVIVCMVNAGGASIDLHDLEGGHQRVSLVCPTYEPIQLMQVLGRTRRAGSRTVPIIKLVYADGTIEEKVARTVASKLDNIEALNKGDLMEPDLFNILEGGDDARR